MNAETRIAEQQGDVSGPRCPFCSAHWTQAMLDQYDAMVDPNGCACCGSAGVIQHVEGHREPAQRAVPTADLCCESCGNPIFRAPGSL